MAETSESIRLWVKTASQAQSRLLDQPLNLKLCWTWVLDRVKSPDPRCPNAIPLRAPDADAE